MERKRDVSLRHSGRPRKERPARERGGHRERETQAYRARGPIRFLTLSDGGRSATLMVGPVRGPEHLALIRRARFYHVPVSAIAASRTGVAYIAFYEGTSRFGGRAGVIREYAPVLRVSRVRRADLPGLTWPGRQGEDALYYRFDLGPMLSLDRPITNPDRLRVAFRFPDFERFRGAATLRDVKDHQRRGPRRAKDEAR